jgi:hypothetical protein
MLRIDIDINNNIAYKTFCNGKIVMGTTPKVPSETRRSNMCGTSHPLSEFDNLCTIRKRCKSHQNPIGIIRNGLRLT